MVGEEALLLEQQGDCFDTQPTVPEAEVSTSGESEQVMFQRVIQHVEGWSTLFSSADELQFTRMSGMSNACYKVEPKNVTGGEVWPRAVLYRKFECEIVDKTVEDIIFTSMSEQGLGPKKFFADSVFRIEEFFEGKPISIWEMRNPFVLERCVRKICEFNYNTLTRERIASVMPLDASDLVIHKAIRSWGPQVKARLLSLDHLLQNAGLSDMQSTLNELKDSFLFDGFQQHFINLVPNDGQIVLAHNDTQENNILKSFHDNQDIILIDYEYGGWNPLAMDLANYINECACDNAYPYGIGIKFYPANMPSREEREEIGRVYSETFFVEYASD